MKIICFIFFFYFEIRWECNPDAVEATFDVYTSDDTCSDTPGFTVTMNGTDTCYSTIWTTNIAGLSEAVGLKLLDTDWRCPDTSASSDDDDDGESSGESTDDDSSGDSDSDSDGDTSSAAAVLNGVSFVVFVATMIYSALQ